MEKTIMTERQIAYDYLIKTKCGYRDDLIKKITLELFDEFRLIGFIKEGMDGEWKQRWKITDFGESQITSHLTFIKISEKLKLINKKYNIA
jgi:hypothetical protein